MIRRVPLSRSGIWIASRPYALRFVSFAHQLWIAELLARGADPLAEDVNRCTAYTLLQEAKKMDMTLRLGAGDLGLGDHPWNDLEQM